MSHAFSIDPYDVLGVGRRVTPEELRSAYHEKVKKHHPDRGGDTWAFRIVARAFEILSLEVRPEVAPAAAPPPPPQPQAGAAAVHPLDPEIGRARPGVRDAVADPLRLVEVEVLWVRYQVEDPVAYLYGRGEDPDLSGCLNLTWPARTLNDEARNGPDGEKILGLLQGAIDALRSDSEVLASRSRLEGGRFVAWLSYPRGRDAWEAFQQLRRKLHGMGLGVRQWSRDLIIARDFDEEAAQQG